MIGSDTKSTYRNSSSLELLPSIMLVVIAFLISNKPVWGATFDVLKEEKSGFWSSVLYKNQKSGREFCALETVMHGTYLRLNRYKDNEETFLELYNPDWRISRGKKLLNFVFGNGEREIEADLAGESWGDSFTYDVLKQESFEAIVMLMGSSSTLAVKDEKGQFIEDFMMEGSGKSADKFLKCLME